METRCSSIFPPRSTRLDDLPLRVLLDHVCVTIPSIFGGTSRGGKSPMSTLPSRQRRARPLSRMSTLSEDERTRGAHPAHSREGEVITIGSSNAMSMTTRKSTTGRRQADRWRRYLCGWFIQPHQSVRARLQRPRRRSRSLCRIRRRKGRCIGRCSFSEDSTSHSFIVRRTSLPALIAHCTWGERDAPSRPPGHLPP